MRLLRLEDDGEFSLVEHIGRNVPPYAIFSHTWGADHEEVTFKDLTEGEDKGKDKVGYRKLTFCGEQAAKDNLWWFWVDTCCIDKSSSAELSEAINSMFRWYHNAAKCYVYLSDVSVGSGNDSSTWQTWKPNFQHSRWFTRGWTLQELVAPTSVEFFSLEGVRLGDRDSMIQEIHEITRISVPALQGNPLSQFSVDERMLWAADRKTKREEDAAYSLLGIFGVHMSLIYGEGGENAFLRLRREIDYTANIENLFRMNQEILLDTQRLVHRQQDTMQFTRVTAATLLSVTYMTTPLVIAMVLFSMPEWIMPIHLNWATFLTCYLVILLFISAMVSLNRLPVPTVGRFVINLFRPNTTSSTPSQDNIELQQSQV